MNDLTEEQRALRDAVRSVLARRSDSAAVRKAMQSATGYDVELWRTLCEQIGVAALAVPEEYGGIGASAVETHVVFEELGRMLTPSPMLGTYLATRLLVALGGAATGAVLEQVAGGAVAALAWSDAAGRPGALDVQGGRVDGTAHYVLDGDTADLLVAVGTSGAALVDPATTGTTRTHTPAMDLTRRLTEVSFAGVQGIALDGDARAALAVATDAACVALSAEAVGAATRILDLTVDYTKVRVQFGRPIGSFQALKHRMADLHVQVEAARSASYAAARGDLHPSVAKAYCAEAFQSVAGEAIQLHGGIAITWEHDAHLYFKRAHGIAQLFGQPSEHVARLRSMAGITAQGEA